MLRCRHGSELGQVNEGWLTQSVEVKLDQVKDTLDWNPIKGIIMSSAKL